MTQFIGVLGGLGDAYLLGSLYGAFCRHHQTDDVGLIIKSGHEALIHLFEGVRYVVDDDLLLSLEADQARQLDTPNDLWSGRTFFAHPCMARTRVRLDRLTVKSRVTQADMFRAILDLPSDASMALPRLPGAPAVRRNTVLIVEANTWPDAEPEFYPALAEALEDAGRDVWVNDRKLPLRDLLMRCAATEWVIGPQCGLMSVLINGRWPCRKTLATPDIDGNRAPDYLADETYPYAYATTFAGMDYDVEEFKIGGWHRKTIDHILGGANFRRLRPHDPNPVLSISVPLAPGEFLDKLAVLTVKDECFEGDRRAAIRRELDRLVEIRRTLALPSDAVELFERLLVVHRETFSLLEREVPRLLREDGAVRLNRDRIGLKAAIDSVCRAPYSEVKSYYGDEPLDAGVP